MDSNRSSIPQYALFRVCKIDVEPRHRITQNLFFFLDFSQRNYTLFIVYHTISGLLDNFDGTLARSFNQLSHVGQYFETILDQFSHVLIYASIGYLYPKYIIFFFAEIALELWSSTFHFFVKMIPQIDQQWPHHSSFLSQTCSLPLWDHPNLRLYRWYGSDIFHTLLIVRYILIHETDQPWVRRLKQHVPTTRLFKYLKYLLVFMGISSFLRTILGSCHLLDNLQRLGTIKKI